MRACARVPDRPTDRPIDRPTDRPTDRSIDHSIFFFFFFFFFLYRKYEVVNIYRNEFLFLRKVAQANFCSSIILSPTTILTRSTPTIVKLDKPIYIGSAILFLSKNWMTSFFYDGLVKVWQTETSRLSVLMSDTDSFIFQVEYPPGSTRNFYREMLQLSDWLDFSTFDDENHPLIQNNLDRKDWLLQRIKDTKGVLGLLKSEMAVDQHLTHVITLRPKLYCYETTNSLTQKTTCKKLCKGISKAVIKQQLTFKTYQSVLENEVPTRHAMYNIRSREHHLSIEKVQKTSASLFEDKRFWVSKYHSLPHGHHLIPTLRRIYQEHDYLPCSSVLRFAISKKTT